MVFIMTSFHGLVKSGHPGRPPTDSQSRVNTGPAGQHVDDLNYQIRFGNNNQRPKVFKKESSSGNVTNGNSLLMLTWFNFVQNNSH